MNRVAGGNGISKLLRVRDVISGVYFLVDSGAEVSILTPSQYDRKWRRSGVTLSAANGADIASFGTRYSTLRLGSKEYSWNFTVADVNVPILGADFLAEAGLLVDLKGR